MRISDWSSDVCSSDLEAEWSDDPNVPDEVHERIAAIDVEIGALVERPLTFDAQEMARAGVFVSIAVRSEEHTSALRSLMRMPYPVFCLQKKNTAPTQRHT